MAIQSARVLDDGWTLEVEGEWAASAYADFQLFDTPGNSAAGVRQWDETTARVVLTVQSPGYNRVGLEAVAGTVTRTVVAHDVRGDFTQWPDNPDRAGPVNSDGNALYGAWPSLRALNRDIREVNVGGGVRRIRLRLHKPIQPGDTFSIEFKPDWRVGHPGGTLSGSACINASTTPIEKPSVRWLVPSYEGTRDSTLKRVSVHAAHGLPVGKRGVAGVRFIATDGVNKVTAWADLGWDTQYGDNVRCWTANMDMTGLNAGPCVVHWSVFPWVGTPRHSAGALDPATAAAFDLLPVDGDWNTAGIDIRAENPLIFGYDPTGSYYGYTDTGSTYWKYVCVAVDPDGGVTTNPASRAAAEALCGFGTTAAAARSAALAISTAGRARTTLVALTALRLLARNLPTAVVGGRGRAARTNAGDGFEIFLVDGTHRAASGIVSGTTTTGDIWPVMRGNGRTDCTLLSAAPSLGIAQIIYGNRMRVTDLTANIENGGWFQANSGHIHWHNCNLGRTASSTSLNMATNAAAADRTNFSYLNCELGVGPNWSGNQSMSLLMRSCRFRSVVSAIVFTDCETYGGITENLFRIVGNPPPGSSAAAFEDIQRWNNRLYSLNVSHTNVTIASPEISVGGRRKLTRLVLVNNLVEITLMNNASPGNYPVVQIGEGGTIPLDVSGCVVEGNTITGQRMNMFYNELFDTSSFLQAQDPMHGVFYNQNRVAGNIFDQWAAKGATIPIPGVNSARAAALPGEPARNRGFLTQADFSHQPNHGFMVEENVVNFLTGSTAVETFRPENRGLKTILPAVPDKELNLNFIGYEDPRDINHGATGGGDYRASATALWRAWVRSAQIDHGVDGVERTGTAWAAGALAGGLSSPSADSVPDAARHLVGSTPGLLSFFPQAAAVNAEMSWLPLGNREPQLSIATGEVASGPWRRIRVGPEGRFRTPERD